MPYTRARIIILGIFLTFLFSIFLKLITEEAVLVSSGRLFKALTVDGIEVEIIICMNST